MIFTKFEDSSEKNFVSSSRSFRPIDSSYISSSRSGLSLAEMCKGLRVMCLCVGFPSQCLED